MKEEISLLSWDYTDIRDANEQLSQPDVGGISQLLDDYLYAYLALNSSNILWYPIYQF